MNCTKCILETKRKEGSRKARLLAAVRDIVREELGEVVRQVERLVQYGVPPVS